MSRIASVGLLALVSSGCVTKALVGLGKPERPEEFHSAVREGERLRLSYRDDGEPKEIVQRLSRQMWVGVEGEAEDPRCVGKAWKEVDARPERVPRIAARAVKPAAVAEAHRAAATGSPPMTVQGGGDDAWIVCGGPEAPVRTDVASPKRSGGAVAAIVVLFPFALIADICGGFVVALVRDMR